MLVVALFLSAAITTQAKLTADPSGGWLSYAIFKAPEATDVITKLSASMEVPETPENHGGQPAFWFGIQTAKGDGALIQPIMSKWLGDGFFMFQEIFDWTDMRDKQSEPLHVKAGDVVTASVTYESDSHSYIMNMTSRDTNTASNYHYKLLPRQKATESVGYFVLEHQPNSCKQLPPNGYVGWTDIAVEVNGQPVADAQWVAAEERAACGSKAVVIDSTAINITWNAETAADPQLVTGSCSGKCYHTIGDADTCFETTYTDAHFQSKGYANGNCNSTVYAKRLSTEHTIVCNRHSEENLENCKGEAVTIKIFKMGRQ